MIKEAIWYRNFQALVMAIFKFLQSRGPIEFNNSDVYEEQLDFYHHGDHIQITIVHRTAKDMEWSAEED